MYKVAIILPSYNHANFLKDRLDSILNQTYKNWKIIIIDDLSNDGSDLILKEFVKNNPDKILNFIINKKNSGSGYHSWKKGIELAKSDYIWIAETDDYSDYSFLENMVSAIEKEKSNLIFCGSVYVNKDKEKLYSSKNRLKKLGVAKDTYQSFKGKVYLESVPFNTLITNGSSVLFKKPKGIIPEEIFVNRQSSDIFFWTYLLKESSFTFLNKNLNFFRRHENSTTTKNLVSNQLDNYKEKLLYIRFFKFYNKEKEFLNHFFKKYILKNKKNVLKINFLGTYSLKIKYFYVVAINVFSKFKNK